MGKKTEGRVVGLADGPQPAGARAVVPVMQVSLVIEGERASINVNVAWGDVAQHLGDTLKFGLQLQQILAQLVAEHYDKLRAGAGQKPQIEVPQIVLPRELKQ